VVVSVYVARTAATEKQEVSKQPQTAKSEHQKTTTKPADVAKHSAEEGSKAEVLETNATLSKEKKLTAGPTVGKKEEPEQPDGNNSVIRNDAATMSSLVIANKEATKKGVPSLLLVPTLGSRKSLCGGFGTTV